MSPDQPTPSGKPLMRRLLYLGSGLLACATLFDLAREGLSGGSWHATAVLGQAYGLVLAAYAALRESEKWADPQDQRSYGGHWFLLAWCGLPALLWLADITNLAVTCWPESLNKTLAYVLAAYAGSKASSRWRGFKLGTFTRQHLALRLAPVPTLTTEKLLTRHALRLGSMLLGAVCLCDSAVQGFSAGEWYFNGNLYTSYYLVLGAYSATREWEKWTDPLDQDSYWGGWFVAAWFILPFVLWLAHVFGAWIVWPAKLMPTLATVLGVFIGGKASAHFRPKGGIPGGPAPAPVPGGGGAPGPAPNPVPGGGGPLPGISDKQTGQFAEACRRLGLFSSGQIMAAAQVDHKKFQGFIGLLIGKKLVRREGKDLYRWIGP